MMEQQSEWMVYHSLKLICYIHFQYKSLQFSCEESCCCEDLERRLMMMTGYSLTFSFFGVRQEPFSLKSNAAVQRNWCSNTPWRASTTIRTCCPIRRSSTTSTTSEGRTAFTLPRKVAGIHSFLATAPAREMTRTTLNEHRVFKTTYLFKC